MSRTGIERPAERYGNEQTIEQPSGISGKIIAVVLVVLLVGIVFGIARYVEQRSSIPVQVSISAYERQDDSTMRLWVDITREDPNVDSYCIVTALNYEMSEVGRREVLVPAGGESAVRVAVDIPTRDYPVSGDVYGCSTDIHSYQDINNPVTTF